MLYAIVGMLVIILDQGVKYWVTNHIMLNTVTEPLIPGILSLVRMHNDGAAFSILSGGGARVYFIILTGIFTVAVIIALVTNFINGKFGRWCLVIVTAAGLSNCLDRILYGFVVDMFKVDLFNFAVFNVADIFITVFSLLFIFYIIFGGEKEKDRVKDEFDEFDDEEADSRPLAGDLRDTVDSVRQKKGSKKSRYDDFEEEKPRKASRRTYAEGESEENYLHPMRKPKVIAPSEKHETVKENVTAYKAPTRKSVAPADDPFAAWERANEKAENSFAQSPAAKAMGAKPVKTAPYAAEKHSEAPTPHPVRTEKAAPKIAKSEDEFDLDAILAEFK